MFTINVNCICCEKGKDKTVFVTKNFWSQSDSLCNLSGVTWTILAYLQTLINIVPSPCHFHSLHMFSFWPQLLTSQHMRNRVVIAKWSFFYTSLITHCETSWQHVSFSLTMKWLLFRQSSSWNGFTLDCKQPLFCFVFSEGSGCMCDHWD